MKKILLWIIFVIVGYDAKAQDMAQFQTPMQQFVQSAVNGTFVSIERSYRLQDPNTKRLYGKNGSQAFGSVSSWGVKVESGIVLNDKAVRPWEYDKSYEKYREKYDATAYQAIFVDKDSTQILDSINVKTLENNTLYLFENKNDTKGEGLKTESTDGNKNGWFVWLVQENDSVHNYLIFKKPMDLRADSVYVIAPPATTKKLLAGIYVEPSVPTLGSIVFKLCGILVEQNGKWILARISVNSAEIPTHREELETIVEQDDEDTDLTPIEPSEKKTKKNKKNRK